MCCTTNCILFSSAGGDAKVGIVAAAKDMVRKTLVLCLFVCLCRIPHIPCSHTPQCWTERAFCFFTVSGKGLSVFCCFGQKGLSVFCCFGQKGQDGCTNCVCICVYCFFTLQQNNKHFVFLILPLVTLTYDILTTCTTTSSTHNNTQTQKKYTHTQVFAPT